VLGETRVLIIAGPVGFVGVVRGGDLLGSVTGSLANELKTILGGQLNFGVELFSFPLHNFRQPLSICFRSTLHGYYLQGDQRPIVRISGSRNTSHSSRHETSHNQRFPRNR